MNRRCLVLADGFYEWKEVARGRKTPFRFVRKDGSPFAFAGLWEVNRDEKGQELKSILYYYYCGEAARYCNSCEDAGDFAEG